MEHLLNFEIAEGSYIPMMGVLILLTGYLVTDKLFLHENILLFNGQKAWAVAAFSVPIFVAYMLTGSSWESVIFTYLITNGLYDIAVKPIKS